MTDHALLTLYSWAKANVNSTLLFGYVLVKINAQTPGRLFMLLRRPTLTVPSVEIEVIHRPAHKQAYQLIFSVLPFHTNVPRPDLLRPSFPTQQALIDWLQTADR